MLVLLAAIGALGSVAIHLIVPAMPAIAADLNAPPPSVQLAISLYLVGMAAGQLAGGFASDQIGRRPVILAAAALFTIGSIGAACAGNVSALIGFRMLQAIGGGGAIICARTIVADLSGADELAGRIAFMTSILLVSPALSPAVGGMIADSGGWRANFLLLAGCGAALLAVAVLRIRESLPAPGRTDGRLALRARYGALIRASVFWRLTIVIACSSSTMYAFLTASPFLLVEEYRLSSAMAGMCYLSVAASGIAGTLAVRAMERRRGALRAGVAISFAGTVILFLMGLSVPGGAVALMAPMLIIAFGVGLSTPAGMAAILQAVKGMAGAASSLAGAAQMFASGLATTLIAQWHVENLVMLSLPMMTMCGVGLLLAPPGRAKDI